MTNRRCDGRASEGLLRGIELFNAGEYFECHEVLEEIWRAEADPVRALYQGILQIGVALYHLRRGNWRGAAKLLDGGVEKVGRFLPQCMGVDTRSLHVQAGRCLARLTEIGPDRLAEFEWTLIPTIAVDAIHAEPDR